MIFYLKRDIMPNYWIIVGKSGNVISGPNRFAYPIDAENWAKTFLSSWQGAQLVLE